MKIRKITADQIYTNTGDPLENTVIILDDKGTIIALDPVAEHDQAIIEKHQGIIVPGFINAHCHLELSHMQGKVDTGTGLLPFLQQVVNFREVPQDEIDQAIDTADTAMQQAGIVAVGDISNKADTFAVKQKSDIRYYSFVEMFDFLQDDQSDHFFTSYKEVYDRAPGYKSAVPHAPYTVSPSLFQKIRALNTSKRTISIHNQETKAENDLFLDKSGEFLAFYASFGFPLEQFTPIGKTSIHYTIQHLDPDHRYLFVHNTLSTREDITAAHHWNREIFWVTCPNANLYIENKLPNYALFLSEGAQVCIGTDSLTSNWQLSVFEEMKSIARYQSYVPTKDLVRWATLNGARALGFDDNLGTIETGKTPGLNLITVNAIGKIDSKSIHKRLA